MFLSKNAQVVGIDFGSHCIKLAQLKKRKNGFELMNFGLMPINPEFIVDGVIENVEGVADALKRLLLCEKIRTKYAVTSVSGESVIIKKISVPVMTNEQLAESIKAEAEQYIPYDIEEVNVDSYILPRDTSEEGSHGEGERQMDVVLAAIKKDVIESRIQVLKSADLHPVVIDLDVFAIENCFELNGEFDPRTVTALVNIGASFTNINILEGGITAFTRDIPIGALAFNFAIQKELNVSLPNNSN
jgi:type IV pilus assembly protein PilM